MTEARMPSDPGPVPTTVRDVTIRELVPDRPAPDEAVSGRGRDAPASVSARPFPPSEAPAVGARTHATSR